MSRSIDADHFKALNESQGHQRGDGYLMLLAAELIKIARRQIDVAARCGGEEFAVVLPETSAVDAARVAETVRAEIAESNAAASRISGCPVSDGQRGSGNGDKWMLE
jgi:diguanylate cyclase (GGDEF)-like protein